MEVNYGIFIRGRPFFGGVGLTCGRKSWCWEAEVIISFPLFFAESPSKVDSLKPRM